MTDQIHLRIVTPDGVAYENDFSYLNIPTPDNSVGILSHHAPMLCAVREDVLLCRRSDGQEERIPVGFGTARVENNTVLLLVQSATSTT